MSYDVTVSVPYAKKLPYTLFAKGVQLQVPSVEAGAAFVHFQFLGGTVFVLFYTFKGFRRAYVATCWQNEADGEAVTLPGVDRPCLLLFTARGRKIDHLKRCLYLLTQEEPYRVFSLPLLFWYQLAALIQFDDASKSDVLHLYGQFKRKKIRRKR